MGRRLSLLCCPCLPRKQQDNLSSRSLYLDQDSSGQDDYSDEEDEYQAHASLLTSFPPSTFSPNTHHTQPNYNPWPSGLSDGRFSRHSTFTGKRKPNPFRGFTASPEQEDQEEEQERRWSSEGEERDLKPYRDDEDDDDNNDEYKHATHKREEGNALNKTTVIHAQTHYAPYRVSTLHQPFSQQSTTTTNGKRIRPPRNPQGKMAWFDGEEDAEEVIDVDALIAEQERITQQLAAQEEALRQEEEAAVVSKRLAAIRAAEKRGLLRFDGDQLVIESSSAESKDAMAIQQTKSQMSSSTASSFVGGIDAFNQELKMMTFEMSSSNNKKDANTAKERQDNTWETVSRSSSTSRAKEKPARSASSPSVTRVSAGVSTSTSTSTSTGTANQAINPRDVLNNITSFLKKVDGVIAGEGSSSDEASFSDQEQALSKSKRVNTPSSAPHGPQSLVGASSDTNKPAQGPQSLTHTKSTSHYSTATATATKVTPVAIEVESSEQYPTNPFNTASDDRDESYPADPFNNPSLPKSAQEPIKRQTPGSMPKITSLGSTMAKTPAPSPPKASGQSEHMFSTFTSLFNTGSSFVGGFFGGGVYPDHHTSGRRTSVSSGRESPFDEDDRPYDDGNYRSSSAKYGNPQEHTFDHQEHYRSMLESASVVTDGVTKEKEEEEEDDDASIDDYDF